jgi:inner membrane protein
VASIGHVAIGLAAARCQQPGRLPLRSFAATALLWSALSLLPDSDVVGFSFGVRYEDPWGHRGATHSFAFAILAGAVVGAVAALRRRSPFKIGGLAAAVMASHPILDTLTDGGLGCALFWPFSLTRYFAPWNPIPVAPIGLAFFSPFGLGIAAFEFVQFSPLFVWAWSPGAFSALWTRHRAAVIAWVLAVLILVSPASGRVREAGVGIVLREDTEYAPGYSERRLGAISIGAAEETVRQSLGPPLQLALTYPTDRAADSCFLLFIDAGRIVHAGEAGPCGERGISPGQPADTALAVLGEPQMVCWMYTRSPGHRPYRLRGVCFVDGRVLEVMRFWWQNR